MTISAQDLLKGIDLILAGTSIGGSQFNQLVDEAKPATNRGLVITTTDTALNTPEVPDPSATVDGELVDRFVAYIWRRLDFGSAAPKLYVWNPNLASDPTTLKWVRFDTDTAALDASITAIEDDIADLTASLAGTEAKAQTAYLGLATANTAIASLQADVLIAISLATTASTNAALRYPVLAGVNDMTATLDPAPASLAELSGRVIPAKVTNANTGASSINWNGFGAVTVKDPTGVSLVEGQIRASGVYLFVYDATLNTIFLLNPSLTTDPDDSVVFDTEDLMAATMDVTVTKPSNKTWYEFELIYTAAVSDGSSGGAIKIDFTYETAPLAGTSPSVSNVAGCGNSGAEFALNANDDTISPTWHHKGVFPASLRTTDNITFRATRTLTLTPTPLIAHFTIRATYR